MKKLFISVIVICFMSTVLTYTIEEEGLSPDRSEDGPLLIHIKPGFLGASLVTGYKGFHFIPGRDTIIWGGIRAFWENTPFYRDFNDNLLTAENKSGIDIDEDLNYYRFALDWTTGITQGIIWNSRINANLLDVSLFYRGKFIYNFENEDKDQVIFNQAVNLPDMQKIQQNTFIGGFSLNNAVMENHIIKGVYSEVTAEWGPRFMNKIADFVRINFGFKGFIPLVDIKAKNQNHFSIYLGDYFTVDWITGETIPVNIRQSMGSFKGQRFGLGGMIRAVDEGRFDAGLKIANCFDIRINLPLLMPFNVIPGFIVFFDSAYYNRMKGSDDGFLLSTGGGIFFNLMDRFQFTMYTGAFLNRENVDGKKWKPFIMEVRAHF
jgi:hypothetical protein